MTIYFKELTGKRTFIADELPSQGVEWAKSQGLTHIMQVNGGSRYLRFSPRRTRAYIAVDENSEGKALLDRWKIRQV